MILFYMATRMNMVRSIPTHTLMAIDIMSSLKTKWMIIHIM